MGDDVLAMGDGNTEIFQIHFPHSLSLLYSAATYTGLRVNRANT
jgi:hypothetical protein